MIGAVQFACEALFAEGRRDRVSTADGMSRRLLFAGEIRVKNHKTFLHRCPTVCARLRKRGCLEQEVAAMATIETTKRIPWWKEPTKDQWLAW